MVKIDTYQLSIASDERGPWAPYVGELWDAIPVASSESAPAIGRGTQIPEVEVRPWPRVDAGTGPLVWLTAWFTRRMWPVEAIPRASSS
jgi:hypothetical protein